MVEARKQKVSQKRDRKKVSTFQSFDQHSAMQDSKLGELEQHHGRLMRKVAAASTALVAVEQTGYEVETESGTKDLFLVKDGKSQALLRESYGFYATENRCDLFMWSEEVHHARSKGLLKLEGEDRDG